MDKKLYSSVCLEITTKDARSFRCLFMPSDKDATGDKVFGSIHAYAFPGGEQYFFAFSHRPKSLTVDGWKLYNDLAEYARMGIDFAQKVRCVRVLR